MSLFLKLFNTTAEYNAYTADTENFIKPNVSYCVDENEVHYNEYDYYDKHLTFIAREQGTFTLTIGSAVTTSLLSSVSYSLDEGETWTTTNNQDDTTVTITTPTVNQGDKVMWKGSGVGVSTTINNNDRPSTSSIFSSTGEFDVQGNILSLVWGDEFADKNYVAEGSSYNFALLFYANTGHVGTNYAKVVSAKNLCLPIKNLPTCCYFRMFQESDTFGTVQPNNTLAEVPRCINADSIGASGCTSMFLGCASVTNIPSGLLPATTLAERCYDSLFCSCASLASIPSDLLHVTNLSGASYCYNAMFGQCTSLTSIPSDLLPATTLAEYCYYQMFYGCTSLTTVPSGLLPATTLASYCYSYMFWDCTSLRSIPSGLLPATTLASYCYCGMFYDCTSLTTVPSGLLPATTLANGCYIYMFCDCTSLTTVPSGLLPATTLAKECYAYMFYDCTSLTTAPSVLPATTLATYCYQSMFRNCTSLTTAPSLPATTLAADCYQDMFNGCTSLTVAPPTLPALTVPSGSSSSYGCYMRMFRGCTSLTSSPIISATTIGEKGMSEMFRGCTNLSNITCLATDISATNCTQNWVNGVAASGTFTKAASMESWTTGASGIPSGWSVQDAT